jgi:hypothetical protein
MDSKVEGGGAKVEGNADVEAEGRYGVDVLFLLRG